MPTELELQTSLVSLARDESPSLTDRLARICTETAERLRVARVGVWLFSDDRTRLDCVHLYDSRDGVHSSGEQLDSARYPHYFEALEQARTVAASDAANDAATHEFATEYLERYGVASMLDAPLRREGRLFGVQCHEHVGESRDWTPNERAFAAASADLSAMALETDRRLRYTQRLRILNQTGRAILAARSIAEIAQVALAGVLDLVPSTRSSVLLFDSEYSSAMVIGATPEDEAAVGMGTEMPATIFGNLERLEAGEVKVAADLSRLNPSATRDALVAHGIRTVACVPLRGRGGLIGTLNLASNQPDAFHQEHLDIAVEVAAALAVAIRQAGLRQKVERHAAQLEQRVAERTRELEESRERLRALYDNTPVMMQSLNAGGHLLEVNQFWLDTLGYQRNEVIGRHITDFVPPEAKDVVRNVILPKLSRDGYLREAEVVGQKKNGETVDLVASSVVKRDENGNFLHSQTFLVDVTEQRRSQRENLYLKEQLQSELHFEEIIGRSPAMMRIFSVIEMVAPTDSSVLLLGETGTGKELLARAVHNLSRRRRSVMIKVNCAALPANLVESELFGHERGAFTGALNQKKGRFELAHGGSIFLDEVGELPIETQTKLLRVLQEQEFERLGGTQTVKVDVRIIAATNRDLEKECRNGNFRPDLFYRLNVFPLEVPPLRDRKEDVPLLAAHFVRIFSKRMGRQVQTIHGAVLEQLADYDWPGNVRELANLLERAVILCMGEMLEAKHILLNQAVDPEAPHDGILTLQENERRTILKALERTGGVLAGPKGAAHLLGINRSTLWSRMRKLGIDAGAQH